MKSQSNLVWYFSLYLDIRLRADNEVDLKKNDYLVIEQIIYFELKNDLYQVDSRKFICTGCKL